MWSRGSAVGEGAGAKADAEVGERHGAALVREMEAGDELGRGRRGRVLGSAAVVLRQVFPIASRERAVGKRIDKLT
jgi:hypothetical protein